MQEDVFFGNGRGEKMAGVVHYPKETSKAVILCHGFRSSKENKAAWAERLSDNFAVLRFDFSGHGESGGDLEDVTLTRLLADMNAAIDFMIALGKGHRSCRPQPGRVGFDPCFAAGEGNMLIGGRNGLRHAQPEQVRTAALRPGRKKS